MDPHRDAHLVGRRRRGDGPRETFQKEVGKSAAPVGNGFTDKPKGTCVCQDAQEGIRAGVLRQYISNDTFGQRVVVECVIPAFDASTGARAGFTDCLDFVALPK